MVFPGRDYTIEFGELMRNYRVFFGLLLAVFFSFLLVSCGQTSEERTKKNTHARLGWPAPDFSLTDTSGRSWKLSELKGKAVFLNFWATWCPPCRQEMPSMELLNRDMASKGLQMLTVLTNDDPAVADRLIRGKGWTFPVLVDPNGAVANAYGITGVPETFIIDMNGILREKFIGGYHWDSQSAKDMIQKYVASHL